MLIKTFRFGQDWKHGQRHRETKINKSWNAPDLSLLAKDNKKWDPTKGPIPTRAVVGANQGQNVHLSDVVSDILEPLATCMISMEAISSEDWLSNIDEYNMKVKAKVTSSTEDNNDNIEEENQGVAKTFLSEQAVPHPGINVNRVTNSTMGVRLPQR